jgi:4'-phosphopantetheinyl transferase
MVSMILSSDEIHLYHFAFKELEANINEYESYLSESEKQRAARFHFEIDQNNFKIGRAVLRKILAGYIDRSPADLNFQYSEKGKPLLSDTHLQFNLSHTKEAFLIGCSQTQAIGVDIELISRNIDVIALSREIMSAAEKDYFLSQPAARQKEIFFRVWTRKEAFVKALGIGIGTNLKNINTIPGDPDERSEIILNSREKQWKIMDLPLKQGHFRALAIEEEQGKTYSIIDKSHLFY